MESTTLSSVSTQQPINQSFLIEMANQLQINSIAALIALLRMNGNWTEDQLTNWSNHLSEHFDSRQHAISGNQVSYEYIDGGMIAMKVFFYGLYLLIFFLGIAGNALVCYVVLRNSSMHTVTNMFILNLAISDILLCILSVPFTPLYLLVYKAWVFGSALCHLVPFAQGVSVYISAFTLMSIAIDRYFVIIYPFKARMPMKICFIIIVTVWLSAGILTLPYGIFMDVLEDRGVLFCDEHWPFDESRKAFGISTSVLQFVIPFVIITYCYVRVCGKLWDRARARPGSVSMRREEMERERTRRTNGMLISMVVIFVISWLPLNCHNLVHDFYIPANYWKYSRAFFVLAHAVAMSSTCYNPFLYAWLNENFRKEFKLVLPCFRTNCSSVGAMEMRRNIIRHECLNNGNNAANSTGAANITAISGGHSIIANDVVSNTQPLINNKVINSSGDNKVNVVEYVEEVL